MGEGLGQVGTAAAVESPEGCRGVLLTFFPWLGTDESVSGGDVVERLGELYETLGEGAALASLLKGRFPQLGTDEELDGGDAVDGVVALEAELRAEGLRRRLYGRVFVHTEGGGGAWPAPDFVADYLDRLSVGDWETVCGLAVNGRADVGGGEAGPRISVARVR